MRQKTYIIDNQELMSEWDWDKNNAIGLDPKKITYGSAKKVWWKCVNGHSWVSNPNHRSKGRGCPICAEKQRKESRLKNIIKKRGSLHENNPELASQWHLTLNGDLTPIDVTINSSRKVWWQCEKGHTWKAAINSRTAGANCPVCSGHKIVVGVNDLATVRPDLAKQWHPIKNGELKSTDVTVGNGNSVWWQCEKGHTWKAKISNRGNGNNCPICIGKKVLVGFNDLATVLPSLAKEWHPIKNGNFTPQQVTVGSNKRVWWLCNKEHEWVSSVNKRSTGCGCPQCADEMRTSFPEQAIFFYLRKIYSARNRYMLNSKTEIDVYLPEYKIGVEYDGLYFHNGSAAKKRELDKEKTLKENGILLLRIKETKESIRDDLENNVIYCRVGDSEKELSNTIYKLINHIKKFTKLFLDVDIDVSRDRFKIYEQYIESEKEKSLHAIYPSIAKEWHPIKNGKLQPEHVSYSSNKKVWWQCEFGHEWEATINSRKRAGCPYCGGKKVLEGFNDLRTANLPLALEWHPTKNRKISATCVTANSNKVVWWNGKCGHEWKASVAARNKGGGCPFCAGKKVFVGYNDLATINPRLTQEWNFGKNIKFAPTELTAGSDKKVWWKCSKGHEWMATISSRSNGCECPYCTGQKLLVGDNDLETTSPILAKEWHPTKNGDLTPRDVMRGTNKKAWWKCSKGHEWMATISSRSNGRGCPYCAGQKLLAGENDLETTSPILAKEWHPTKNGDLTPRDVMRGTNKKVWWQCEFGHEWEAIINSRSKGAGCPKCWEERRRAIKRNKNKD
ncbi:MAG: zinc-ribbon domain-containing protein [Clostridia bacterium]|nr:zinc-ribbon domain-containing protein [Clostridia bacterium]